MKAEFGITLTRLLISHLCHELVSPVGAINNGVELIQDFAGQGVEKDAFQLIAQSGKAAAIRLRFYRLAYGNAGTATDFRLRDARSAAQELFEADRRVTLEWPELEERDLMPGSVQVALDLVVLSATCLPRGGTISIGLSESGDEKVRFEVRAEGPSARILDAVADATRGASVDLDHRTVHARYCHELAALLGESIEIVSEPDLVAIGLNLPVATEATV